jgi:hypothetical protein
MRHNGESSTERKALAFRTPTNPVLHMLYRIRNTAIPSHPPMDYRVSFIVRVSEEETSGTIEECITSLLDEAIRSGDRGELIAGVRIDDVIEIEVGAA